jgi:hypothetical protein
MSLPERIGAVIKVYYNLTLISASLAHISASLALPRLDFARLHHEYYASDAARSSCATHGYSVFKLYAKTPNGRH